MRVAAPLVLRNGDRDKLARLAASRAGEAGLARRAPESEPAASRCRRGLGGARRPHRLPAYPRSGRPGESPARWPGGRQRRRFLPRRIHAAPAGLEDLTRFALRMASPGQAPTASEACAMLTCAGQLPEQGTELDRTCLELVRNTAHLDTEIFRLAELLRARAGEWLEPRDADLLDLVAAAGKLEEAWRRSGNETADADPHQGAQAAACGAAAGVGRGDRCPAGRSACPGAAGSMQHPTAGRAAPAGG